MMCKHMNTISGFSTTNLLIGLLIVGAIVAGGLALWYNNRTGDKIAGPSQDYEKILDDLRKVDPSEIIYSESAKPVPTNFTIARAVAVGPEDQIYVAGDRAVRKFDREGKPSGPEIPLKGSVYCLAVSEQGTIFVGLKDRIEVYDQAGKKISVWEVPKSNGRLTSIAVKENDVFAALNSNNFGLVYHYDRTGQLINSIVQEKSGKPGPPFDVPSPYFDVAVGPDEMVHIAHTGELQIEKYTFRGHFGGEWGIGAHELKDFFGCCNPVNFALLPKEKGYITCEKGITRVKEYDFEGRYVGVVAAPDDFPKGQTVESDSQAGPQRVALDVAVDSQGRVLILDPYVSQVRIYTRK